MKRQISNCSVFMIFILQDDKLVFENANIYSSIQYLCINIFHDWNNFFQIEHAQHLASGTAARFGDQGIVASMQVWTTFWQSIVNPLLISTDVWNFRYTVWPIHIIAVLVSIFDRLFCYMLVTCRPRNNFSYIFTIFMKRI